MICATPSSCLKLNWLSRVQISPQMLLKSPLPAHTAKSASAAGTIQRALASHQSIRRFANDAWPRSRRLKRREESARMAHRLSRRLTGHLFDGLGEQGLGGATS